MPYSRVSDILLVGDRASQPAANTVSIGTIYSVDDEGFLQEQSDGANWVQFGPDPADTVAITALTGDVTATGPGSAAATIAANAVSNTKLADMNANTVKCRAAGTSGDPSDVALAASQLLGRGSAGNVTAITLGTGLTMTSDTLSSSGGSGFLPSTNEYRLSATTAVPVTTSDVTTTSTVYWVPYKGTHCSVFDGASAWQDYTGGELSIALSGLTANLPYDVFLDYNGGTEQLALIAWTSDSARATALTLQDGILVLTGATDHRYLGTIRTIATNATADSGGGVTTQVGGKRFIWNYYNRVRRTLAYFDGDDSWNYATNTWRQANGKAAAKVEFVVGVAEDGIDISLSAYGQVDDDSCQAIAAIGYDSITVPTSLMRTGSQTSGANVGVQLGRHIRFAETIPAAGYHYAAWLERGNGNPTVTWFGDAGSATDVASAMAGNILG